MQQRKFIIAIIVAITVIVIFASNYQTNQNILVNEAYGYKITRQNTDWSFVTDFEKTPVLKSKYPEFSPELSIAGTLIQNSDNKLMILVFSDNYPEKDLTEIVEKEKQWAIDILDGDFFFPEAPVGNSVYLEWNENIGDESSEFSDALDLGFDKNGLKLYTRELIFKENGFVYFVYYEIHSSRKT